MKAFLAEKIDEGQDKLNANVTALTSRMEKNEDYALKQKSSTDSAIEALKTSVDEIKLRLNNACTNPSSVASYAGAAGRAAAPPRPRNDHTSTQY